MDEFKFKTFSIGVTVAADELDRPPLPRKEPFWRAPLVALRILDPLPPHKTTQQIMDEMQERQYQSMLRMRDAMDAKLGK